MISSITPRELKVEITDACNLRCQFCYLSLSSPSASLLSSPSASLLSSPSASIGDLRQGAHFMPEEEALRWIDWTVDNAVPGVRFTGGEATLHPQIEMLCSYAHLRGRYVILNTNGLGNAQLYRKLFRVVNDVRISLPTLDARRMDGLTGGTDVLVKKQEVIRLALEAGVPHICLLTPLLPELLGTLENFVKFAQTSPRLIWLPLRYEATPVCPRPWTHADAQAFAEEMADLMDRYPEQAQGIFLAMPFCGVRPTSLGARVFHGRTRDCGPFAALNVNARGRMQACFDVGEMEGVRSLAEIRNAPAIHACASVEALPEECRRCAHIAHCAGGCRKPYGLVPHGGQWIDYLAGFLGYIPDKSTRE